MFIIIEKLSLQIHSLCNVIKNLVKNKRMKKLLMIACIAMFTTTACKKDNPPPHPPPPEVQLLDVTITGPAAVLPDEIGTFTATLSKEAEGVVTIKVTNANPALLTFSAEEIIIEKGKTEGKVDFRCSKDANGVRIKVSFTSVDAIIKTQELIVNVSLIDPPKNRLPTFGNGTFSAISKIVIGNRTMESSVADSPEGPNQQLAGNDFWDIGGISEDRTNCVISLTDGISYTIYYDNFTANDGIEMAVALYMDWNADGDLRDEEEEIITVKGIPANAKKEISGIIFFPAAYDLSALPDSFHFKCRVMCYSVEGNEIKGGEGYAGSGYLMDFICMTPLI